MKLLTLLFAIFSPTSQVFCVAVISNILIFYILYHMRPSRNIEQKAADQSAKATSDKSKKDQTIECDFDIEYVWNMEAEISCGISPAKELITMALVFPDALTPHDIFEVGRRVERLCDCAANLKSGDRYYSESYKHFDQCRRLMHTLQHRFNSLDEGAAIIGGRVSQAFIDRQPKSKEGLAFGMLWNDNGVLRIVYE